MSININKYIPPSSSSLMTLCITAFLFLLSNPGSTRSSRVSMRTTPPSCRASASEQSCENFSTDSINDATSSCSLWMSVSSSCGVLGGRKTWLIAYSSDAIDPRLASVLGFERPRANGPLKAEVIVWVIGIGSSLQIGEGGEEGGYREMLREFEIVM